LLAYCCDSSHSARTLSIATPKLFRLSLCCHHQSVRLQLLVDTLWSVIAVCDTAYLLRLIVHFVLLVAAVSGCNSSGSSRSQLLLQRCRLQHCTEGMPASAQLLVRGQCCPQRFARSSTVRTPTTLLSCADSLSMLLCTNAVRRACNATLLVVVQAICMHCTGGNHDSTAPL
jgi:hypothetical protein